MCTHGSDSSESVRCLYGPSTMLVSFAVDACTARAPYLHGSAALQASPYGRWNILLGPEEGWKQALSSFGFIFPETSFTGSHAISDADIQVDDVNLHVSPLYREGHTQRKRGRTCRVTDALKRMIHRNRLAVSRLRPCEGVKPFGAGQVKRTTVKGWNGAWVSVVIPPLVCTFFRRAVGAFPVSASILSYTSRHFVSHVLPKPPTSVLARFSYILFRLRQAGKSNETMYNI